MRFRLLFLLLLSPLALFAQLSDTLEEQVVSGRRTTTLPGLPGVKTTSIGSEALLRPAMVDISRILSENLPVFVRPTGVNGPASLSIRGASAAQSLVLWEDVPLQNPSLGMTDISLLQSGLFERIQLIPGGAPALWGSGNVGGALRLQGTKPSFSPQPKTSGFAGVGGGSFGLLNASAGITHHRAKSFWAARAFGNRADYEFDYQGKHIDNGKLRQYGALLQGGQQLSRGFTLRQDVWLTQSERGIPPALFESNSVKQQRDAALRIRLSLEKATARGRFQLTSAWMREALLYEDSSAAINSALNTTVLFARAQYQRRFKGGKFFADAPVQYAFANAGGKEVSQQRIAFAAGLEKSFWKEKLQTSFALRTENIDAQTVVLPGLNASFALFPKTLLRASVQRSYRAPTLAERYYFPGGNTALKPEMGWGGELGAKQSFEGHSGRGFLDATVFYRDVRDWIIWYGGAIWTPHNIARVETKGVEIDGEWRTALREVALGLRGGYTYTLAKTLESAVPNDGSVGCRLPHLPQTTARASLWAFWKSLRVEWASVYTGYRFITSDESAWIPAYWLHSATAGYGLKLGQQTLNAELRCNNLANESFLSVAGRPGLPRHFTAGVMWGF